jgi:mono/diheme cytochrome c family protein
MIGCSGKTSTRAAFALRSSANLFYSYSCRQGICDRSRVDGRTNNAKQNANNGQRRRRHQVTLCTIRYMKTKALLALTTLIICAAAVRAGSCDWKAPPTAVNRPNPVPSNANTIALGQKLFAANCQTCHGASGKGDGPGGAALEKKPADLGACIKSNNETDGSLFWKISEGRSPMVSWKGALSETQRWELVNYIKTLAGK